MLAEGIALLRAHRPEDLRRVRVRVVDWMARLERMGLRPDDVTAQVSMWRALKLALHNATALVLGLPAAATGALAYAVPFIAVRATAARVAPEPDVVATVKLLASVVYFPIWHVLVVTFVALRSGWQGALVVGTLLPLCGMYTRHFVRRRRAAIRDVSVFLKLASTTGLREKLEGEREHLSMRIARLADAVDAIRESQTPEAAAAAEAQAARVAAEEDELEPLRSGTRTSLLSIETRSHMSHSAEPETRRDSSGRASGAERSQTSKSGKSSKSEGSRARKPRGR